MFFDALLQLEFLQLADEAMVRLDFGSFLLHVAKTRFEVPALLVHQVGDDDGCAAGHARIAVHQHAAVLQIVIDKIKTILEMLLDVVFFVVAQRNYLVVYNQVLGVALARHQPAQGEDRPDVIGLQKVQISFVIYLAQIEIAIEITVE